MKGRDQCKWRFIDKTWLHWLAEPGKCLARIIGIVAGTVCNHARL